jgi:hypothetical protein
LRSKFGPVVGTSAGTAVDTGGLVEADVCGDEETVGATETGSLDPVAPP